jgi:glycine oxidase
MAQHPDVLVLGGGVIGLTTAYFLARKGVQVAVLEQGDFGRQASWAGAGIIPPGDSARACTPYNRLRALSAEMYPDLSRQLRERTSLDNGYVVCGGLELVSPGEELPAEEWCGEGITFREVRGAELRALEPGLAASVTRGYHFPGMAQVRNPRHVKALRAGCEVLGVELSADCPVQGFVRRGQSIEAVTTPQGNRPAGRFLVAAGAWSEALLAQVGWRPGIRPVRGQIALLNTGEARVRPVLLQGKRYLVPRPDGRVLVGSTEEDAGFDARPTAEAIAELLSFAIGLVPELGRALPERSWAGLRPGSPDGLPFLGAVPGCDNLFVAAGHFRSGIQLSPATGLVMQQVLLDEVPAVPLDDFRLDRPLSPPAQTAFRS